MNKNKSLEKGFIPRVVLTVLICVLTFALGAVTSLKLTDEQVNVMGYVALGMILFIAIILLPLNYFLAKGYKKKLDMSVADSQNLFLERQAEARKSLKRATGKIVRLRLFISLYSFILFALALFITFALGISKISPAITIFPAYVIIGYFNRIQLAGEKYDFSEYVSESDYPHIYSIAYKAQKTVGIKGEIKIVFLADCNAGIARIGKVYSLQLGVALLDILTEEELYQVLLHEFAHTTKPMDKEQRLFNYITQADDTRYNKIISMLFRYCDFVYTFEYFSFRTTSSQLIEEIADKIILEHGDPEAYASSLIKLAYNEYFSNELYMHMKDNFYEPESRRQNVIEILLGAFRKALPERKDFWNKLISSEIQARSASHPIVRSRLEAVGVSELNTLPLPSDGEYRREFEKALARIDNQIYENGKDNYENERKEEYLEPLSIVNEWRENKRELTAEEARPIMSAMHKLSMVDELYELSDELIKRSKTKASVAEAYMSRGHALLLKYDKSGIDDIYTAIEENSNYIDAGLELIGKFLCMMGLQKELDEFREKSVEIQQKQKDVFSQLSYVSPDDDLALDDMDEDLKNELTDHIVNAGQGKISHIYLVKKIITEDFFASTFIIRFQNDTSDEDIDEIMNKIFYRLDSGEEERQYSLFIFDSYAAPVVAKVQGCCIYEKE